MNNHQLSAKVWQNPLYFIAFGFGTGLLPKAPGTWGTLAGIVVYLIIAPLPLSYYLVLTVAAFILGVWVSEKVCQELGTHDYGGVVWDEVVGYLLTMINAPAGIGWIICGFILFRIFDIWKPEPIRYIDRHIKGGVGVMFDDALAAIPAWLILQAIAWGIGA